MGNDTEVFLLFAPFWLLGIAALLGGLWHAGHAAAAARREHHDRRKHHVNRAVLAFAALVAVALLGLGVGAAVGLVLTG